jgi:chromosomal replication initiation ATPase DnaA
LPAKLTRARKIIDKQDDAIAGLWKRINQRVAAAATNPATPEAETTSEQEQALLFIEQTVANHFKQPMEKIRGKSRLTEYNVPRFFILYFQIRYSKLSMKTLGERMGGRDHTTVMNARDTLKDRIDVEEGTRKTAEMFEEVFKNKFAKV